MMKEISTAGPACSAAAVPVTTKMPVPITAPMPSAVMPHGPSVRRRPGPWAWSSLLKSVLRASNWLSMGKSSWPGRRAAKASRPALEAPAAGWSVGVLAQLAVAVTVEAVDQEADRGPAEDQPPAHHERLPEQEQAGCRAERADDPHEWHAECARQIRARVAKHQHADAYGGERQQRAHRNQVAEHVDREQAGQHRGDHAHDDRAHVRGADRKSTRLNSSHVEISYAVFCLKKKKRKDKKQTRTP